MQPIILASSSPYRQALLQKMGLPFIAQAPDIDETAQPGESPIRLVQRLAIQKAQAIQPSTPSWVIGSDQVAVCRGQILTKSHTSERAFEQLSHMSGQKVRFITGLCLLNSKDQTYECKVEIVSAYLRPLSPEFIRHYIEAEKPFDCAGSFKVENRGIALVEKFSSRDLNALVGLPLIQLVNLFKNRGISIDHYWKK
jgi:MAF protein